MVETTRIALHGVRHSAGRTHNFLTRAIVERNDKRKAVIAFREFFGLNQQPADVGFKIRSLTYHAHADIAFVKFGQIVSYKSPKQSH